jgi:hypothetical protein
MHRIFGLAAILAVNILFCPAWVLAIAPNYVSDVELASYPIVVVARWEKAGFNRHAKHTECGQGVLESEAYTRLNILSVLRGTIELGEVDLQINYGISWAEDGTFVNSGTSTQLVGDVNDITKPCLWFLKRKRSWDEERKDEYLSVSNYREIQPVELKEFYQTLAKPDAKTAVPKLLATDQSLVADRVLLYLCGGTWPWPVDDRFNLGGMEQQHEPLRKEANRLWEYIQSVAKPSRPDATSVYAELAGKDGIENIRTLLDDKDPKVRAMAVGVLARHRDEASASRFAKAVESFRGGGIGSPVVDALSSWGDPSVVPALIEFLQNDDYEYGWGDDIGIPALKARQGLKKITGHVFPFDVELSRKAWQDAAKIDDPAERRQALNHAAPAIETPLIASAEGSPKKEASREFKDRLGKLDEDESVIVVRVRNTSSQAITVLRFPFDVVFSTQHSSSSRSHWKPDEEVSRELFTTIEPGDSIAFEVIVDESFLSDSPPNRSLKLSYLENGKGQGLKAWIGTIDVQFGAEWKPE